MPTPEYRIQFQLYNYSSNVSGATQNIYNSVGLQKWRSDEVDPYTPPYFEEHVQECETLTDWYLAGPDAAHLTCSTTKMKTCSVNASDFSS